MNSFKYHGIEFPNKKVYTRGIFRLYDFPERTKKRSTEPHLVEEDTFPWNDDKVISWFSAERLRTNKFTGPIHIIVTRLDGVKLVMIQGKTSGKNLHVAKLEDLINDNI